MEDIKKFLWIIFFIVLTIVVITNIKEMAIQLISLIVLLPLYFLNLKLPLLLP